RLSRGTDGQHRLLEHVGTDGGEAAGDHCHQGRDPDGFVAESDRIGRTAAGGPPDLSQVRAPEASRHHQSRLQGVHMSLDLNALEASFDLVAPHGNELMDEFYARLFAAAPAVRPLFPDDMTRQKTMLLGALVLLRKSLRDLDAIVPKLRELGARHVAYGARPEHYPLVGETLIASLAAVAGDAWTADYERAWTAAYELVASVMLDGAREAEL